MRHLIGLVALAGCATVTDRPVQAGPCRIDEQLRMRFVATEFRPQMRDELVRLSNARSARVLGTDDAATMDFREDRLNIDLDDRGRIAGLRCG